jgi:molybdopterin converting factor small subunit
MPTIRIPTPLRQYTENQSAVSVEGATAGDVLKQLAQNYPQLQQHLFEDGKLRSFVNVYLNEEDIRYLDGEETVIRDDDTLMIIPSIAGGRRSDGGVRWAR